MDPLLTQYWNEWKKSTRQPWKRPSIIDLFRDYRRWKASQSGAKSPLLDQIPWITFSAIRFLEKILNREMIVFEYGIGGSTIFFAQRVRKVVSIEHDDEWALAVNRHLMQEGYDNVEVNFVPPLPDASLKDLDPQDPALCISASEPYLGHDFSGYVNTIEKIPDSLLDVILIDGRARPACFRAALGKVKVGGYICMDNTERDRYARATQLAGQNFQLYDFPGPSPYVEFFTRTSVWRRMQ